MAAGGGAAVAADLFLDVGVAVVERQLLALGNVTCGEEADARLIAEEKMDRLSYPRTRMSCNNEDRAKSSLNLFPTILLLLPGL